MNTHSYGPSFFPGPPTPAVGQYAHCDGCRQVIPFERPRVRCLDCPDYDSCGDCQVTQTFSGNHTVEHRYEVLLRGQPTTTPPYNPSGQPSQPAAPPAGSPEAYWGMLITPSKTASPMFSRLIAAIFARFATPSADVLQPNEFCALMAAAGHTSADFPLLNNPPANMTPASMSPTDLTSLDAWLISWYRASQLEHRTSTRQFPAPPPPAPQPFNGRFRLRDQLLAAVTNPTIPAFTIPNGMPLLTRRGLEQYFVYQAVHNPDDLFTRINNLLGSAGAPPLVDGATGRPFDVRSVPRGCLPPMPDAQQQRAQRAAEAAHAQDLLEAAQVEAMIQAKTSHAILGGWTVDSYGNRRYDEGLI
ncbi:hypothetical protein C8A05DRAFT_19104 [Staphylotrichum tortipilum]|uniref:ZZ-type domain-containing protein n=1 Tax=Staphylotrichum tortipilum TaxID=2831512 RepID=A0AAN6RPJ8_9PEZI|nr:hypothetical protein C8A05DRAFT_19104 [Staphylotrichum longicolle]